MRMFLTMLLVSLIVGCVPPGGYTRIHDPSRKGEIPTLSIGGHISGLPDGVCATIQFEGNWRRGWAEYPNGPWKVGIHSDEKEYAVTAVAEGYVSTPASYRVRVVSDTAYVVRDGQVTGEEAVHLDFHFVPKDSP